MVTYDGPHIELLGVYNIDFINSQQRLPQIKSMLSAILVSKQKPKACLYLFSNVLLSCELNYSWKVILRILYTFVFFIYIHSPFLKSLEVTKRHCNAGKRFSFGHFHMKCLTFTTTHIINKEILQFVLSLTFRSVIATFTNSHHSSHNHPVFTLSLTLKCPKCHYCGFCKQNLLILMLIEKMWVLDVVFMVHALCGKAEVYRRSNYSQFHRRFFPPVLILTVFRKLSFLSLMRQLGANGVQLPWRIIARI